MENWTQEALGRELHSAIVHAPDASSLTLKQAKSIADYLAQVAIDHYEACSREQARINELLSKEMTRG